VLLYHEHVAARPLTDEEWRALLEGEDPPRTPEWFRAIASDTVRGERGYCPALLSTTFETLAGGQAVQVLGGADPPHGPGTGLLPAEMRVCHGSLAGGEGPWSLRPERGPRTPQLRKLAQGWNDPWTALRSPGAAGTMGPCDAVPRT
jgi:hypothetical protein